MSILDEPQAYIESLERRCRMLKTSTDDMEESYAKRIRELEAKNKRLQERVNDLELDKRGRIHNAKIKAKQEQEWRRQLSAENKRLREALLSFKKQYHCSPWIIRTVDEALEAEDEKETSTLKESE